MRLRQSCVLRILNPVRCLPQMQEKMLPIAQQARDKGKAQLSLHQHQFAGLHNAFGLEHGEIDAAGDI